MRLQMAEALVPVGIDPARERIDPAREGTVGVDTAAALVEEHARPVLPGLEDGAARLGVAGEEFSGRQTQPASEAQRLVGPHTDRLPVATALARVADVREAAASLKAEIDLRQEITIRNGRAPGEGSPIASLRPCLRPYRPTCLQPYRHPYLQPYRHPCLRPYRHPCRWPYRCSCPRPCRLPYRQPCLRPCPRSYPRSCPGQSSRLGGLPWRRRMPQ